jgi:hypothetical protein
MPNYTYHIRKADHITDAGRSDLHVHVYYNEGRFRGQLIGRFRIPSLEPVFSNERELNSTELAALRDWLGRPDQVKKLADCLESTLFDMARVAAMAPQFADIRSEKDGETYINIKIPVTRRLR